MNKSQGPLIEANHVWKSYDQGKVAVLKGVSVQVRPGEIVALWGSSGSGKSTLLHILGALDVADAGEVQVCGLNPALEAHRLELRRKHLGFVFQLHNLLPDLSVLENIQVPALASGVPAPQSRARALELAAAMEIEHRVKHRIQDLSGGERQRVALCRALCMSPKLIIADEPTGSLDEATGERVFALLTSHARKEGSAVLLATHERRFAEACDRVLRVRNGLLESSGA